MTGYMVLTKTGMFISFAQAEKANLSNDFSKLILSGKDDSIIAVFMASELAGWWPLSSANRYGPKGDHLVPVVAP